ncbi:hypothetical protein ACVWXN_008251 [Bradyrhizobium sp. i1.4.4]
MPSIQGQHGANGEAAERHHQHQPFGLGDGGVGARFDALLIRGQIGPQLGRELENARRRLGHLAVQLDDDLHVLGQLRERGAVLLQQVADLGDAVGDLLVIGIDRDQQGLQKLDAGDHAVGGLRLRLGDEGADRGGDREILRGDVLGGGLNRVQARQRGRIGEIVELEADLVADAVELVGGDLVVLAGQRDDLTEHLGEALEFGLELADLLAARRAGRGRHRLGDRALQILFGGLGRGLVIGRAR